VLLRNLLVSREPLYGLGEWAARYAPDFLGLEAKEVSWLNDDRAGRAADRLFLAEIPALVLEVVRHVVRQFQVGLDELHNDSTSVTVYGAYLAAAAEKRYHSTQKAALDAAARASQIERALKRLGELQQRLTSPRTRYRQAAKVQQAVEQILQTCEAADCLRVAIVPCQEERFRQEKRGRPGPDTHYVKTTSSRFQLSYEIDGPKMAEESQTDGVFPLVSNVTELSELELLHAYKRQPTIEKRFSQLKTDFAAAPVYLKEVRRIQALLCLYFFALLVEALLEHELRRAMQREQIEALPIYPEGRPCCWPTARRLLDLFEPVQRHTLSRKQQPDEVIVTELTALQRRLLKLLGLSARGYGR